MEIIQIKDGTVREIKNRWGETRNVTINREYVVKDDAGNVIGGLRYVMITRERRTPGKRYVNARWQSPGWRFFTGDKAPVYDSHWRESDTKKHALHLMELLAPKVPSLV